MESITSVGFLLKTFRWKRSLCFVGQQQLCIFLNEAKLCLKPYVIRILIIIDEGIQFLRGYVKCSSERNECITVLHRRCLCLVLWSCMSSFCLHRKLVGRKSEPGFRLRSLKISAEGNRRAWGYMEQSVLSLLWKRKALRFQRTHLEGHFKRGCDAHVRIAPLSKHLYFITIFFNDNHYTAIAAEVESIEIHPKRSRGPSQFRLKDPAVDLIPLLMRLACLSRCPKEKASLKKFWA